MRYPDWVSRLSIAINFQKDAPFEWGTRDCCLAAADLVMAVRDTDVAAPFRPLAKRRRYATRITARKAMLRYIGADRDKSLDTLEAVAVKRAAELGLVEVPVLRAQRGDLVLLPVGQIFGDLADLQVLSVVNLTGMNVLFAPLDGGWAAMPLEHGKRAWRI